MLRTPMYSVRASVQAEIRTAALRIFFSMPILTQFLTKASCKVEPLCVSSTAAVPKASSALTSNRN